MLVFNLIGYIFCRREKDVSRNNVSDIKCQDAMYQSIRETGEFLAQSVAKRQPIQCILPLQTNSPRENVVAPLPGGNRYKQISRNTQAEDGDYTTSSNCI